jgi:hypothetical protein
VGRPGSRKTGVGFGIVVDMGPHCSLAFADYQCDDTPNHKPNHRLHEPDSFRADRDIHAHNPTGRFRLLLPLGAGCGCSNVNPVLEQLHSSLVGWVSSGA